MHSKATQNMDEKRAALLCKKSDLLALSFIFYLFIYFIYVCIYLFICNCNMHGLVAQTF